jgi:TolB protein
LRTPGAHFRITKLSEVMVHRSRISVWILLTCGVLAVAPGRAAAQAWFQSGTGLGVEKPKIAVADFAPREDNSKNHSQLFTQVVRDDLQFSGIVDLVSPSFYPVKIPTTPSELNNADWVTPQINANLVAFGNLTETTEVVISGWVYDVRSTSTQAVVGKVYRGSPTDAQVRKFAHQFADEIISRLSGGLPGVASTQIAFVSSRTHSKEIWVMDYDGANQHPLTSLHSISLTPRWSPDASRIAFTCFAAGPDRVVSPQICMYSVDANKVVSFPRFRGSNYAPAWSPDGSQLIFSSSMLGNPELFVSDANGAHPRRLTYTATANTSAAWNPKTGQSIVFVSDRGGIPKLYLMNADGTNTVELDLPDKGYLIDPAWSPNGTMVAFSWRRPDGNFDIYIMEPITRDIRQITRDSGKNERPSWAPDGRHIVFESTRGGTRQIWTMLADGSQPHQLTIDGDNESPNWSPK